MNKMTEYKTDDGWDLESIEPLHDFVNRYDDISRDVYELRNCVRGKTLVEMRDSLLEAIEDMKIVLKQINDEDILVEEEEVE